MLRPIPVVMKLGSIRRKMNNKRREVRLVAIVMGKKMGKACLVAAVMLMKWMTIRRRVRKMVRETIR